MIQSRYTPDQGECGFEGKYLTGKAGILQDRRFRMAFAPVREVGLRGPAQRVCLETDMPPVWKETHTVNYIAVLPRDADMVCLSPSFQDHNGVPAGT